MSKKELIQIRVTEDQKRQLKSISAKKGMTLSEYLLSSAMRSISEDELIEIYYKKF